MKNHADHVNVLIEGQCANCYAQNGATAILINTHTGETWCVDCDSTGLLSPTELVEILKNLED